MLSETSQNWMYKENPRKPRMKQKTLQKPHTKHKTLKKHKKESLNPEQNPSRSLSGNPYKSP